MQRVVELVQVTFHEVEQVVMMVSEAPVVEAVAVPEHLYTIV